MIKINTEKIDIKKLNEIDDILYPNKDFFIGSMVGIIIILLFFLFLIPITLGTFSLYLYKNNKENYDKAKESKDKAIEMINDIITFQVNNSIEMKQE